jgi:hypothetical protein
MLNAKYKYAVTHDGQAHRDDLITAAILLASGAVKMVSRRTPTVDELEDPEVIVFDTGDRHEPEKGNFDHNKLHNKPDSMCALWLVMKHMGLDGAMSDLFSWYNIAAMADICCLTGPLDDYLTEKLSKLTTVDRSTAPWLVEIGESVMAKVNGYLPFSQNAEKGAVHEVEIQNVRGLVATDCDPKEVKSYLSVWRRRRQAATGETYAFSVTRDDGGPGLCLYRYEDDERINFQVCAGDPATVFVHAGGFIVKTKDQDLDEAERLIRMAIEKVEAPK